MKNNRIWVLITVAVCVVLAVAAAVSMVLAGKDSDDAASVDSAETTVTAVKEDYHYKAPTPEEAEAYPKATNLPTLYINLDNGVARSKISHDIYIPGTYSLVVDDNKGIYNQPLEIKGRGNYSWSFQQKPYNLKLAEKTDLLGMGSAKKWVLVPTYSDKTLLRNFITLNLAVDMGMQNSPEAKFVDVYINGKYNGLYVLTEKIQIHKNRVNIDVNTAVYLKSRLRGGTETTVHIVSMYPAAFISHIKKAMKRISAPIRKMNY